MKNKQKKIVLASIIACMLSTSPIMAAYKPVAIKPSPDKYTFYIKDYIGNNLANVGYTGMDEDRHDKYGNEFIDLMFVSETGEYIDPADEELLKEFVVIGQEPKPNTELKFLFYKDEETGEDEGIVDHVNHEEVLLKVKRVDGNEIEEDKSLTEIKTSPDVSLTYIKDYVGRNLANCGYIAMSGKLNDSYGKTFIHLAPVTSDGSFIDESKIEDLSQYKVVAQSLEPNTEFHITIEDDHVVKTSLEEIQLTVEKLDAEYIREPKGEETSTETADIPGVSPEFKEALDSYEKFFDSYIEFMASYDASDLEQLDKLTEFTKKYAETMEKMSELESNYETMEEAEYLFEVQSRINFKLLEAGL